MLKQRERRLEDILAKTSKLTTHPEERTNKRRQLKVGEKKFSEHSSFIFDLTVGLTVGLDFTLIGFQIDWISL
jgi:hypothetical protein